MGIEPTFPEIESGSSIAVELRGGPAHRLTQQRRADGLCTVHKRELGRLRWTSGAADMGLRSGTRTRNARLSSGGSLTVSNHPFVLVR